MTGNTASQFPAPTPAARTPGARTPAARTAPDAEIPPQPSAARTSAPEASAPATGAVRGLRERAASARERLDAAVPLVPEPRAPVEAGGPAGPRDLRAAADDLVAALDRIEADPAVPEHHALLRVAPLVTAGIPEAGWSGAAGLDVDALLAAGELAGQLHQDAADLLARLDAAGEPWAAVVVDELVTALQVIRMVADLEAFARGW